jgi:hypothetical protein
VRLHGGGSFVARNTGRRRKAGGRGPRPFRNALAWLALLSCLLFAAPASAHSPQFRIFSKFEATTAGDTLAVVFAFAPLTVLPLIERDVAHASVPLESLEGYRAYFSQFVFERFFVANDGAECTHPPELDRLFWDGVHKNVVALTKFTCPAPLNELTIRSYVTRDTLPPHELVGDLLHGRALMRNYFFGDEGDFATARISLPSLPQTGSAPILGRVPRHRSQFFYVPPPTYEREYQDLAQAELGLAESATSPSRGPSRFAGFFSHFMQFVKMGALHIFTGYDHVLFIATLVLVVLSWRHLAVVVTAFTAAHSLTLALATVGVLSIPSRVVEPLIALTVLLVAVDAMVRPAAHARAPIAFVFGLIHGLGLSSALRDAGLSSGEMLPALFGFNVGVELGQLAIVAPLFALVVVLRKNEGAYARVRSIACASVAVVAVFWIFMRVRDAIAG